MAQELGGFVDALSSADGVGSASAGASALGLAEFRRWGVASAVGGWHLG